MPKVQVATGVEVEYESFGDPASPTLLLVNGDTSQLLAWPEGFIELLVASGLRVVRYDNRDVGLSTKFEGRQAYPMKVQQAVLAGDPVPEVPYTLSDMAADGIGLLDELGVERAHVAGMSMGGMIVQVMAIEHPDRVASLTSIMSTPGDMRVGKPTPEAREALLAPPPADRQAYIDAAARTRVWASRKHWDPERVARRAAEDYDRMYYPMGAVRQLAAIYASPERSAALARLDVPTLVVHGRDDTLITPEAGQLTAELVDGAVYVEISDMGHDLPEPLWPLLGDLMTSHTRRADGR